MFYWKVSTDEYSFNFEPRLNFFKCNYCIWKSTALDYMLSESWFLAYSVWGLNLNHSFFFYHLPNAHLTQRPLSPWWDVPIHYTYVIWASKNIYYLLFKWSYYPFEQPQWSYPLWKLLNVIFHSSAFIFIRIERNLLFDANLGCTTLSSKKTPLPKSEQAALNHATYSP